MSTIVDRRTESGNGKYITSRQRFLRKNKEGIRKAITKKIADSNLDNLDKGGVDVNVPRDGIHEPMIHHGQGGRNSNVRPGNKQWNTGDKVAKPPGGGGGSGSGEGDPSADGEGEDNFQFHLSEDEFLDILFEDLDLPNLSKQNDSQSAQTRPAFSAHVNEGIFRNLQMQHSKKKQIVRHSISHKKNDAQILELLIQQREVIAPYDPEFDADNDRFLVRLEKKQLRKDKLLFAQNEVDRLKENYLSVLSTEDKQSLQDIEDQIAEIRGKKSLTPKWNEKNDLIYKKYKQVPQPIAKAVMFCLMDVSGSMSEQRKANAKTFYWLEKQFLDRKYGKDNVDIVFIRHTTTADEVDEQTFFYDRKSGGTIVSSSIQLMEKIMRERYPIDQWNIYAAQASDGEDWDKDAEVCVDLIEKLLPDLQAYFYTQVAEFDHNYQPLWPAYKKLREKHPDQFFMGKIKEPKDILPIFRDFFQKTDTGATMLKGPSASFFGTDQSYGTTSFEEQQPSISTSPLKFDVA